MRGSRIAGADRDVGVYDFSHLVSTPPLSEASGCMREGEWLMASLDNLYVVSPPDLVEELWQHARSLNQGKTCVFNESGASCCTCPDECQEVIFTLGKRGESPILGTPVGTWEFVFGWPHATFLPFRISSTRGSCCIAVLREPILLDPPGTVSSLVGVDPVAVQWLAIDTSREEMGERAMPADFRRKRLVLVGGPNEDAEVVNELRRERGEVDTETLPSSDEGSVVSGDEETEMPTPELEVHEPVRMAIRDAFQSMDVVDLGSEFQQKGLRDEDGSSPS